MHPVLATYLKRPDFGVRMARRWVSSDTSDLKTVFVLGPPRSGTTLVQRLMLNHSRVYGFPFETNLMSPRSIFEYARFSDYASEEVYMRALTESRSLVGFFDLLHRLSFPDRPEDSWIIEKTPQHARFLKYILSRMPNAKAVFVVRDGRDTLCSGRSAENIPQAQVLKRHAAYYNRCVTPLMSLGPLRSRVLMVKYEEFTRAPEGGLADICDFLDITPELAEQLKPTSSRDDARAGQRAFERLGQAVTPATVGRWRTEMTSDEIRDYNHVAGECLSYLGYPVGNTS